jgi:predicted membrane-bound spermidine synthase
MLKNKFGLLLGLVIGSSFGTLAVNSEELMNKLISFSYQENVVAIKRTSYQQIVVTNDNNNFCLFLNGNNQLCQQDEAIYHNALVEPVTKLKKPKRVLILGGGDGLALRNLLDKNPDVEVIQVELDPKIIEFAKTNNLLVKENKSVYKNVKTFTLDEFINDNSKAKIKVITQDADIVTNHFKELGTFDNIIVDYPDPNDIGLAKLYSVQHYKKLAKLLNDNGLIVIQSSSYRETPLSFSTIGTTLKASGFKTTLPYNIEINSFGGWGFWIASKQDLNSQELINELNEKTQSFNFRKSTIFPLNKGKNYFESFKGEVNTLFNPKILISYLKEENQSSLEDMNTQKLNSTMWSYETGKDQFNNFCIINLGDIEICNKDIPFITESLEIMLNSSSNVGMIGSSNGLIPLEFSKKLQVSHFTFDKLLTSSILKQLDVKSNQYELKVINNLRPSLLQKIQTESNNFDKQSKLFPEDQYLVRKPIVEKITKIDSKIYNNLILDAGSPTTLEISKFYSLENFTSLKSNLENGGKFITILNSWSKYPKSQSIVLNTLSKIYTYNRVFNIPTPFKGEVTIIVSSDESIELKSIQNPTTVSLEYLLSKEINPAISDLIESESNLILFTQFSEELKKD